MNHFAKIILLTLTLGAIAPHATCMERKPEEKKEGKSFFEDNSPFRELCDGPVQEICDHLPTRELLDLQLVNKDTQERVKNYIESPNNFVREVVATTYNNVMFYRHQSPDKFLKTFEGKRRFKLVCRIRDIENDLLDFSVLPRFINPEKMFAREHERAHFVRLRFTMMRASVIFQECFLIVFLSGAFRI